MKIFKSKMFWEILMYIITMLISLGFSVLVVMALIKYIFG